MHHLCHFFHKGRRFYLHLSCPFSFYYTAKRYLKNGLIRVLLFQKDHRMKFGYWQMQKCVAVLKHHTIYVYTPVISRLASSKSRFAFQIHYWPFPLNIANEQKWLLKHFSLKNIWGHITWMCIFYFIIRGIFSDCFLPISWKEDL